MALELRNKEIAADNNEYYKKEWIRAITDFSIRQNATHYSRIRNGHDGYR